MDSNTNTLIASANHSQHPTEYDGASGGSDAEVKDDKQLSSAVDAEVKDDEQPSSAVDAEVKDDEQPSSAAVKDDEQPSSVASKDESAYGENDVAKDDEQANAIANQEAATGEVDGATGKDDEAAIMNDNLAGVDSDVTKDSTNHSQRPDHVIEAEIGTGISSDNNILLEDLSEQWEVKAEKEKQSQSIDVQLVMESIGLTDTDLSELNAGEAWEVKLNDGKKEEERKNQVTMEALGFTSKELDRMKGEEAWETKIDPEEIKPLHVHGDNVGTKKSRCTIS